MNIRLNRRMFAAGSATALLAGWEGIRSTSSSRFQDGSGDGSVNGSTAASSFTDRADSDRFGNSESQDQDPVDSGRREAGFERDYPVPNFKPNWKNAQINRTMAEDFVIWAHSDLEMVKQLLQREPNLINAAIDWGAGDFETALGGAAHMGRREIVEFLLAKGARPDIFCFTMLGMLDAVKQILEFQPSLIDAKGPHGFSLHFHAQVGQEIAQPVLDYLQSIKPIELKSVPFLRNRDQ